MKKILGLDTIRFICAVWVTISHNSLPPLLIGIDTTNIISWIVKAFYGITVSGPAAVIVFFVISGFCIHYPYKNTEKVNWLEYYKRRYLRICIPLICAILFIDLLPLEYSYFTNASVLWSLIAELIYYTLYPVFRIIKNHIGWLKFFFISLVISYLLIIIIDPQAVSFAFPLYLTWMIVLPSWLLGCILAEKIEKLKDISPQKIWTYRILIWLISCFCLALNFHSPLGYPWTLNIFGILVYFWLYQEICYWDKNPVNKLLEKSGQWSYSLYLLHYPAKLLFIRLHFPNLGYLFNWVMMMIFVLLFSYIFYILVEKPSHNLARKFKTIAPLQSDI